MQNFKEAIESMTNIVEVLKDNGYTYRSKELDSVIEFIEWLEQDRIRLERKCGE